MTAPKIPPMVPPTTAVWRFSLVQSFVAGAEVVSNGVPVETAVATICVGVDDGNANVMEAKGVDVI